MLYTSVTRNHKTTKAYRRIPSILLLLLLMATATQAQSDCGIVDNITYPIDTNQFWLAQDYAVSSPRHQGRFHTGEDWYGGRNLSTGQPVRAAARGRVVYSYALGWGRDGGVVILEHQMPDGTIFYTQYGHMNENETYAFPTRLTCVEQGDIIGAIGDVRPAPHLHFEVRVANPDTPGPGYTRAQPYAEGFRDPGKFIANHRAWLSNAHAWHVMIGNETPADERGPLSPPFVLSDNSLLYLDGTGMTLRRATADGRVLWRVNLSKPAIFVEGFQGAPLLHFRDGTLRFIADIDSGSFGEEWQIEATFSAAPLEVNGLLLYPVANNGLLLLDEMRRTILWQITDIPAPIATQVIPGEFAFVVAWLTASHEVLLINNNGEVLDRSQLRESAAMSITPEGELLVFARGGLWRVDAAGQWHTFAETTISGGDSSAVLHTGRNLYLFDGSTLQGLGSNGENLLWSVTLPAFSGRVALALLDDALLLTSNTGNVALVSQSGTVCNLTALYGRADANQWVALGDDNVLRLAIADQILGLNWGQFTASCT